MHKAADNAPVEIIEFETRQIQIQRRARLRGLSLSVYPNGDIILRAAKTTSKRVLNQFIHSRKEWIQKALNESEDLRNKYPPKRFQDGEVFHYLGQPFTLMIQPAAVLDLKFVEKEIHFFRPEQETDTRCIDLLKRCYQEAGKRILGQRVGHWSQIMQLQPTGVQFRRQKSVWGSCSPTNKLSLNWKLIVSPLWVIDYVVIHELAHIRHKNHSAKFWKLVEQYTDRRHDAKTWLKENHFLTDFLSKNSELW